MQQKIRINDLARELEVKSKVILDILIKVGVTEKKTHSSSIEVDEAERVKKYYAEHGEPGSRSSAVAQLARAGGRVQAQDRPVAHLQARRRAEGDHAKGRPAAVARVAATPAPAPLRRVRPSLLRRQCRAPPQRASRAAAAAPRLRSSAEARAALHHAAVGGTSTGRDRHSSEAAGAAAAHAARSCAKPSTPVEEPRQPCRSAGDGAAPEVPQPRHRKLQRRARRSSNSADCPQLQAPTARPVPAVRRRRRRRVPAAAPPAAAPPQPTATAATAIDRAADWTSSGLPGAAAVVRRSRHRRLARRNAGAWQADLPAAASAMPGRPGPRPVRARTVVRRCVPASVVVRIPRAPDLRASRPPFGAGAGAWALLRRRPGSVPWDVRRVRDSAMFRVA